MSENEKLGTTDRGFIAVGRAAARPLTEAEIQLGINQSMREEIRRPYNPNALNPPATVRVANAPEVVTAGEEKRGTGWADPKPLARPSAYEERLLSGIADKFLGAATPNKPGENK